MQVKALKNIIANREIYNAGEEFEINDVTAYALEAKGLVSISGGAIAEVDIEPAVEIPSLEEETTAHRKHK